MGKVSSEKPCSQIMVRMASDGPKEWTIIELQVISPRGLCPRAVACPQVERCRDRGSLTFLWADLIAVVLTRKGEFETRDSSEGCKLDNLEIGKLSCKGAGQSLQVASFCYWSTHAWLFLNQ